MKAWTDLSFTNNLAVAGTSGVDVYAGGAITNITPYTNNYTLTTPFSTTVGSSTVIVTDNTYNPGSNGGWVTIRNPVSVGGIHLQGPYYASVSLTTISSGTYNAATGQVSLTTAINSGLVSGSTFNVSSLTGTGGYSYLDGEYTATAGTTGTTINYTADTTTITGGNVIGILTTISSGTYDSATGAVSLTTATSTSLISGSTFTVDDLTGTGAVSSLDGQYTATSGTGGTTVNYTAATGLGSITISGGNVIGVLSTISSGSYDAATGDVSLTTSAATGLTSGSPFAVDDLTGTGAYALLAGQYTATSGTTGTTVNYTAVETTITGGNIGGINQYSIDGNLSATSSVASGGTARQFQVTAGSTLVTVVLPAHGQTTGQVTNVADPVSVGGTLIVGDFIITVIDQNTYIININAAPVATSSVYEENGNVALLWYTGAVQQNWQAQSATLDTFGEDLMVCAEGGPVCVWIPETPNVPATPIPTAPQANTGILVASQEQILVCFGSVNLTTDEFDPLLIDWSDVSDYTDFTPSTTNQAGSFRLPNGSAIIGALPVGLQILVWTDVTLYVMQYIGFPLVFGFNPTNLNCGLIGVHAVGVLGGIVFWMSQKQFFVLSSSGPQILPCAVWDQVFQNIDLSNASKSWCWTNTFFNEVNWYYPSLNGGGAIDSYVRFQVDQQAWTYGPVTGLNPPIPIPTRTCGIDQSVFGAPLAAGQDGRVYQHETGNDANGAPLQTYLISGAVQISEGDDFIAVDQIIPDFKYGIPGAPQVADLSMNLYFYDWSQENPRSCGPYNLMPSTQVMPVKGRGRQMQIEFSGDDLGSFWRLAAVRYRGKPNGKR